MTILKKKKKKKTTFKFIFEQEVTQPSEPSENKMTSQQLIHSEILLKPNPEYANAIEDKVNEPETYEEASQNSALQKAMEEEITALEQNET